RAAHRTRPIFNAMSGSDEHQVSSDEWCKRRTMSRLLCARQRPTRHSAAFVLLEVMLGVLIFSIGVLALGQCVNNCIAAESARNDDQRARLALENRMAEIEAGEVETTKAQTDKQIGRASCREREK